MCRHCTEVMLFSTVGIRAFPPDELDNPLSTKMRVPELSLRNCQPILLSPRLLMRVVQSAAGIRLLQKAIVIALPPLNSVSFPAVEMVAYPLEPKKLRECPLPRGVSVEKVPLTTTPLLGEAIPEVSAMAPAVSLSSNNHSPISPSRVTWSYPYCPIPGVN